MKKIITIICLTMGIYSLSNAQDKKIEFGVGVGLNSASITNNAQYSVNPGSLWAPSFFLSADYYASSMFSVKLKAIYDSKGWGDGLYKANATTTVAGVSYPFKYITLPLTANFHFGKDKNWYVMGGPYVGFLLSAENSYNNADLKSSVSSTDAGIDAGIGFKFPVSKNLKLFIEYDGEWGFSNLLPNTTDGAQTKRSAFSVGLNF
jgi:hypothetical protein